MDIRFEVLQILLWLISDYPGFSKAPHSYTKPSSLQHWSCCHPHHWSLSASQISLRMSKIQNWLGIPLLTAAEAQGRSKKQPTFTVLFPGWLPAFPRTCLVIPWLQGQCLKLWISTSIKQNALFRWNMMHVCPFQHKAEHQNSWFMPSLNGHRGQSCSGHAAVSGGRQWAHVQIERAIKPLVHISWASVPRDKMSNSWHPELMNYFSSSSYYYNCFSFLTNHVGKKQNSLNILHSMYRTKGV